MCYGLANVWAREPIIMMRVRWSLHVTWLIRIYSTGKRKLRGDDGRWTAAVALAQTASYGKLICVYARARCRPELLNRSRRSIYDLRYDAYERTFTNAFALAVKFLVLILQARLAENRCDHWCVHAFTIGGRIELVHHHCASPPPPSLLAQSRRSRSRVFQCDFGGVQCNSDAARLALYCMAVRFGRRRVVWGVWCTNTLTHVLKVLTTGSESAIYRYVCMF